MHTMALPLANSRALPACKSIQTVHSDVKPNVIRSREGMGVKKRNQDFWDRIFGAL